MALFSKSYTEKYTVSFDDAVKFFSSDRQSLASEFTRERIPNYPCNHSPCCRSCYFSNVTQQQFEDDTAQQLGLCKVELSSLLTHLGAGQTDSEVADRLRHFIESPKYQVVTIGPLKMGKEETVLIYLDHTEIHTKARRFVHLERAYKNLNRSNHNQRATSEGMALVRYAGRRASQESADRIRRDCSNCIFTEECHKIDRGGNNRISYYNESQSANQQAVADYSRNLSRVSSPTYPSRIRTPSPIIRQPTGTGHLKSILRKPRFAMVSDHRTGSSEDQGVIERQETGYIGSNSQRVHAHWERSLLARSESPAEDLPALDAQQTGRTEHGGVAMSKEQYESYMRTFNQPL